MDTDEHFEDFTTASDWEFFIAHLEQFLSEWQGKPADPENVHNNWLILHEKVTFADWPFKFSYFKKMSPALGTGPDMSTSVIISNPSPSVDSNLPPYLLEALSKENREFPPQTSPHPVAELFCVKEFAVLTSAALEPLQTESKLKVLLSSACIALNNTNSTFPIFIQYHHWTQKYFCGVAESIGFRTSFQMVHLKTVATQFKYLSGLLDVFKSKVGSNLSAPVGITAHFFYKMSAWHPDFTFDSFPPEVLELLEQPKTKAIDTRSKDESTDNNAEEINVTLWNEVHAFTNFLPFGSLDDPFKALDFVAGWPFLTEDVVVDTPTYSDLEPDSAPEWFFGLRVDTNAEFRLHDMLDGIWNLRTETRTIEEILGKKLDNDQSDVQYMSALDRITQTSLPVPGLNRVINRAQKQLLFSPTQYTDLPPLSPEQLDTILKFLCPDAFSDAKHPYPTTFDRSTEMEKDHLIPILDALQQGVKSAPLGSLVWRLAVIIAHLHAYVGANGAVAHLWAELVLELRFRWENSALIPGLERGSPNSGTCLLNQKLQMLNCCIERKILREKKEKLPSEADAIESPVEESEEEDDEFFDCDDTLVAAVQNVARLNKPQGRLRKNARLRLLKSDEPMYIPITQDPAPLTEDVVEEQARILVELGNDAEGTELRAKMMSASLLSDMESFKAANPGAVLEDFVRWYSPRDWIESEALGEFGNKVGELSPRMKVPGNLWLEVWSTAQPIPARRQKRLFDDTREAEKVLHWMGSRNLSDVSQLILPCLIHAVALKVLEEVDKLPFQYKVPSNFAQLVTQLSRSIGYVTGNNIDVNEVHGCRSNLMSSVLKCEKEITEIRSFQQKFPQINVDELLQKKTQEGETAGCELLPNFIQVEGALQSEVGNVIREIFRQELAINQLVEPNTKFKFAEPFKRVFVLKYNPMKTSNSTSNASVPQRMSCCLKQEEFLLAGTFTSKTDLG